RRRTGASEDPASRPPIGFMLARTHGLIRARMAATLGEGPLHLGHIALLSSLYAENDLTQVQLTHLTGIEKSSVVLFLDALERDGWIERRAHATDRRAHAVHLTRKGRAEFLKIAERLGAAEEAALSVINAAERKTLAALLQRLMAHLQ